MVRIAVLASFAVAAGAAAAVGYLHRTETIAVQVGGLEETVRPGTTLEEAAKKFGIQPDSGDLLDVQNDVLRHDAFPGRILLNGRPRPLATELQKGDRVGSVDGRDRTEPVTRYSVRVRGGMPSNPQFSIGRTPGRQELERGRISGKVAPRAFRPDGPIRFPKAVALTFDDGPSRYTSRVLSELERLHAHATFFVIGYLAERYPRLVRRELRAGMAVGNHSYSHPYRPPFDRQPHERILSEIERGNAVLERLGVKPTLFRPPGGSFSPYVVEATGAHGLHIVLWSVDPEDWNPSVTARQITTRVLDVVKPGSIVLLHDGGGDRSRTVQALPGIVRGIREKGLKLALVR